MTPPVKKGVKLQTPVSLRTQKTRAQVFLLLLSLPASEGLFRTDAPVSSHGKPAGRGRSSWKCLGGLQQRI